MQRPDYELVRSQGAELNKAWEQMMALKATELEVNQKLQSASYVIYLRTLDENLNAIPIDHMNFAAHEVPVEAMQAAGIKTAADLRSAKRSQLLSIEGMNGKTLEKVFDALADMRKLAEKKTSVRLKADHKDAEQTELVLALYRYVQLRDLYVEIEELEEQYKGALDSSVSAAQSIPQTRSWFFTRPSVKRQAAENAKEVDDAFKSGLISRVSEIQSRYDAAMAASPEEAWQAFEQDSVGYYTVLEQFLDRMYDETKRAGGTVQIPRKPVSGDLLPMEIADAVESFELDTSALKATLRNYQTFGVKYMLSQQRTLLGDEMGLGKTVQAIAAMAHLYAGGGTHFMVIAPASVLINWTREIEKFCEMKPWLIHGIDFADNLIGWYNQGGVAVTNFESAAKILDAQMNVRTSMLVVDEAHFVKNPQARRTQNVRALASMSDHAVFMTGTPLENNVEEMSNLIGMLSSTLKGKLSSSNSEKFEKQACGVYLRRLRGDVLGELPEKTETEEWCDLTKDEKKAYRKEVFAGNFMGMRQVSWNIEDVNESTKANRLKELVEKAVQDGRKVIVFSFFLKTLERVREMFGDMACGPISGSIPTEDRQQIIDEFSASDTKHVLVAQAISAGTGLNIQAASVIIFCEPQIKPSIETQAIARAYRMGQVHDVLVYRLLADNTVDERIMEILAEKQGIFDMFADHSLVGDVNMDRMAKAGNAAEDTVAAGSTGDAADDPAASDSATSDPAASDPAAGGAAASDPAAGDVSGTADRAALLIDDKEGISQAASKSIIAAETRRLQAEAEEEEEDEAQGETLAESETQGETVAESETQAEIVADSEVQADTVVQSDMQAETQTEVKVKKSRKAAVNRKALTKERYGRDELFTEGTYKVESKLAPGEYFIRVQDSREQAAVAKVYASSQDEQAGNVKEEYSVDEARLIKLEEGEVISLERADLVKARNLAPRVLVKN